MIASATGRWDSSYHAPVMVEEVVRLFKGARQVQDCTLGGGGHSEALLASGSSVVAIDRDEAAVTEARERLMPYEASGRFLALRGNFGEIDRIPELEGRNFDGILADLGVSSRQIDADERGFSFRPGALLDMRMDRRSIGTAADLLNTLDEADLSHIFRDYGDEPRANRLAREIVAGAGLACEVFIPRDTKRLFIDECRLYGANVTLVDALNQPVTGVIGPYFFGSVGDMGNFHGWLMGYDATTLQQVSILNMTPNGSDGGIWAAS